MGTVTGVVGVRVEADLLIPGAGDPIPRGCVVVAGGTLSYAGPIEGAPPDRGEVPVVRVPVILPGLWDCHAHFMGLATLNPDETARTPTAVLVARSAHDPEKALRAGFTSVREVGGYGIFLARAVREGTLPGPHIYAAGTMLSPTGGHGDLHAYPLDFVRGLNEPFGLPGPCDGVPECLRAVRRVLRLGAPVVKLCSSGGVLSDVDDPAHQEFSDEELAAIVQEAARADRIVAAHCHGKAGIMAALRAGAATIEHGSYLDEEAADRMLRQGALLVPTRFIVRRLVEVGKAGGLPDHMMAKARATLDHHRAALRLAVRKGVPIALGTDIAGTTEVTGVPWGANARELALLVEDGGMTPLKAIEAATANGPRTLGPQASRSGQLAAGYAADLIAVARDPLKDLTALTDPANITHVWKSGELVVDRTLPTSR